MAEGVRRYVPGSRASAVKFALVMTAAFVFALVAGVSGPAQGINGYAYDWLFRWQPPEPWQPQSVLLALDEGSLGEYGGMRHIRKQLAQALQIVAAAKPGAVAIDLTLSDESTPEE